MTTFALSKLPPVPGKIGWPWTNEGMDIPGEPTDNSLWPRISVVTPSFNQAHYIEETLRSVLLQGYSNLELIVVDGGSTDGSVDVIKRYADRIAWWVSERDNGQSHAINKGFRRATGEALGWLNSDDLLFPGALAAIGRAFRERPDAGMIYGAGAKVGADTRVIKEIPFRPVDVRLLHTLFYILQPSCFLSRRALDAVGLLDETQHFAMDWDLALRISRKFPIHAIPDKIGMLRDYPNTKTRRGSTERWLEIARIARKHNGPFDRNVIVFRLLYALSQARRITGWNILATLDRMARRALSLIWSEDTYMAHAFR